MRIPKRELPTLTAAAVMLLMLGFGALRYDHFASGSNLINLVNDYAYVIVAAAGATLVILLGGIDLSVGSMVALMGVIMAALINAGVHPLAAAAICTALGGLAGSIMGALIHIFELPAFIVTLVGMFALRATGFLVLAQSTRIDHPFLSWASHNAAIHLGTLTIPWPTPLAVLVIAAALLLTRRTALGRAIYAIGGNERSARAMGVPVAATRVWVYTLSGVASALAACGFTITRRAGDPTCGVGLELIVIAAVVIGGTLLSGGAGSILGTVIGVMIIGLIRMLIDFEGTLNAAWTGVATGALLLAFVLLQRQTTALGFRARLGYRQRR